MFPFLLLALAFVPMAFEAIRAARNDAALRRMGAVAPSGDVIGVMQAAYPACFIAMAAEAWIRDAGIAPVFLSGLVLFAAAKALKYWAVATLGVRWSFRVLVPPGSTRIVAGPYRFLRHPNYIGVAGELAGMALMARAPVTGTISVIGFGLLMAARVRVEERALETAETAEEGTPRRQRR